MFIAPDQCTQQCHISASVSHWLESIQSNSKRLWFTTSRPLADQWRRCRKAMARSVHSVTWCTWRMCTRPKPQKTGQYWTSDKFDMTDLGELRRQKQSMLIIILDWNNWNLKRAVTNWDCRDGTRTRLSRKRLFYKPGLQFESEMTCLTLPELVLARTESVTVSSNWNSTGII